MELQPVSTLQEEEEDDGDDEEEDFHSDQVPAALCSCGIVKRAASLDLSDPPRPTPPPPPI